MVAYISPLELVEDMKGSFFVAVAFSRSMLVVLAEERTCFIHRTMYR